MCAEYFQNSAKNTTPVLRVCRQRKGQTDKQTDGQKNQSGVYSFPAVVAVVLVVKGGWCVTEEDEKKREARRKYQGKTEATHGEKPPTLRNECRGGFFIWYYSNSNSKTSWGGNITIMANILISWRYWFAFLALSRESAQFN